MTHIVSSLNSMTSTLKSYIKGSLKSKRIFSFNGCIFISIFINLKSILVSTGVVVCFSSLCNEKRKGVECHTWLVKMYNWVLETFYRFFLQLPYQVNRNYKTISSPIWQYTPTIELKNKFLLHVVCSKL